jgi:hypothetical protein
MGREWVAFIREIGSIEDLSVFRTIPEHLGLFIAWGGDSFFQDFR